MRVESNSNSWGQLQIDRTKKEFDNDLKKIASGKDNTDTVMMMIENFLHSQSSTYTQGIMNGNDAIGILDIAGTTTSSLKESTLKLTEMSVAINNGALNNDQKSIMNREAQSITNSMKDMLEGATFNGKSVFGDKSFHLGTDISSFNLDNPLGEIDSLDILDRESIDKFTKTLNSLQSNIGSSRNGISSTLENNANLVVNIAKSKSEMEDIDFAKTISEMEKNKLKLNIETIVVSHSVNYLQNQIGKLLG